MKKTKIKLQEVKVKSFTTAKDIKGGTFISDALTCSIWCGTGVTCPECAYTLQQELPECNTGLCFPKG